VPPLHRLGRAVAVLVQGRQSDKISHIDMVISHIDTVISHIIRPYPISISRMTISVWWMTISMYHIPNRCPISLIDIPIDISLMSGLPYRSPISISHINIGSHLVTLGRGLHSSTFQLNVSTFGFSDENGSG